MSTGIVPASFPAAINAAALKQGALPGVISDQKNFFIPFFIPSSSPAVLQRGPDAGNLSGIDNLSNFDSGEFLNFLNCF